MPYKTGETPKTGDHVKNNAGRRGIVLEVEQRAGEMADEKLTIKWDDGVVPIEGYPAGEFALVSARPK